ncbi:hypothetical protein AKJ65_08165, partial [candidate division MSBL1 archaeon SCGC-AAA259E19]
GTFSELWKEQLKKVGKSGVEFLYNDPRSGEESLVNRMEELIGTSENQLHMAGYLDFEFFSNVKEAHERGVEIKFVTAHPDQQGDGGRVGQAIENYKELLGGNLRYNSLLHTRMLMKDFSEVIIGTADFNRDCKQKYQSGVFTDNPAIVYKFVEFFERMWSDSEEFG